METIHGYPIIARFPTKAPAGIRNGSVILVDKGDEFVTAWLGVDDREWLWGHYFDDKEEAKADFQKRCDRGY